MPDKLDKDLQAESPDEEKEASEAGHSDTQKKEHASGGGDLRELVVEHPDRKRSDAIPADQDKTQEKGA